VTLAERLHRQVRWAAALGVALACNYRPSLPNGAIRCRSVGECPEEMTCHLDLSVCCLPSGCPEMAPGGSPADPSTNDGASTAACDETAALYCHRYFACYGEDAEPDYGSEQACQAYDATYCRLLGTLPGVDRSSSQRWSACNRTLAALSCEEFSSGAPVEACMWTPGTRPNGQGCVAGLQCTSKFCRFPRLPDSATPDDLNVCGVCAPTPVPGDPCVDGDDCGELACSDGKCIVQQDEDGPCAADDQCSTLVCIDNKCAQPLKAGLPCSGFQCAAGLRCVAGECGAGRAGGEPCVDSSECVSFDCGPDGKCLSVVEPGQPCSSATGRCRADAFCDDSAKVCKPYRRQGQACAANHECASHLTCQGGRCQPVSDALCGHGS
jgi:hypothetical protein